MDPHLGPLSGEVEEEMIRDWLPAAKPVSLRLSRRRAAESPLKFVESVQWSKLTLRGPFWTAEWP